MPKRSSKGDDLQNGLQAVERAIGRPLRKNPAAVALGRRGGLKGGSARARKLTGQERTAIVQKAAKARAADKAHSKRTNETTAGFAPRLALRVAAFDPAALLTESRLGKTGITLRKKQILFSQGDAANAVFYLRKGNIKLSVISKRGKEAVVALVQPQNFLGEECVAALQPLRLTTASAVTECEVLRIDKGEMVRLLQTDHRFSDVFVSYLLARVVSIQEDLLNHLFNSSEKRLARILLLLAQFGKQDKPEAVIPKVSQETLAEMVGTTRSRVSFFLNRFRKLGFIKYNGRLQVHNSLLNVVLHD